MSRNAATSAAASVPKARSRLTARPPLRWLLTALEPAALLLAEDVRAVRGGSLRPPWAAPVLVALGGPASIYRMLKSAAIVEADGLGEGDGRAAFAPRASKPPPVVEKSSSQPRKSVV